MKTKKAVQARFKLTKSGKILHKRIHQGHFNAKQTGNERRRKRHTRPVAKSDTKLIKKYLPYN